MSLKPGTEFPQRLQFLYREISGHRHNHIPYRTDMAVLENKAVTLSPHRIFGVMIENLKVHRRENISHSQRPGGMAASRLNKRRNQNLPGLVSFFFEFPYFFFVNMVAHNNSATLSTCSTNVFVYPNSLSYQE